MTTTPTPEQIASQVETLRIQAKRLSRHDPRRDAIDEQVDALVDLLLEARA